MSHKSIMKHESWNIQQIPAPDKSTFLSNEDLAYIGSEVNRADDDSDWIWPTVKALGSLWALITEYKFVRDNHPERIIVLQYMEKKLYAWLEATF